MSTENYVAVTLPLQMEYVVPDYSIGFEGEYLVLDAKGKEIRNFGSNLEAASDFIACYNRMNGLKAVPADTGEFQSLVNPSNYHEFNV